MIKPNLLSISSLLIITSYLPLFIFILRNSKNLLSRIFALHIFAVFMWGAGGFFISLAQNAHLAALLWKFTYVYITFIPIFFYHAVLLMVKKPFKVILWSIYLQGIFFVIATLTNQMFAGVRLINNSFYWFIHNNLSTLAFILWTLIVCVAHMGLILYYKKCHTKERKQTYALIIAVIGFIGGIGNFLTAFGFDIAPYGNFLIPFHSMIITYAILKHQLLDIKFAFKGSIIYSLSILLITSIYVLAVLISEKFLQQMIGYQSTSVSVAAGLCVGLLFFPLRNAIQNIVERTIFKKTLPEAIQENVALHQVAAETERLKMTSLMASSMAHEIKNPLTPLKTFGEMLPSKMNDKNFLTKFSEIIPKEVDRIDKMVTELLQFARPSKPQLETVDIHQLLSNTLNLLHHEFMRYKVQVKNEWPQEAKLLHIDPQQIYQCLLNIFLNAKDAMPEGGQLIIKTFGTTVRKGLFMAPAFGISIEDTGKGISTDELKNIFDPFYTNKPQGNGLGLAITKEMIEKHGGTIEVKSKVGEGTTFTIKLPIAE
ncbi:MAG: ATP-binding protein [Candidatus Omnitrophica bacterium]|nr:ATP-binding protein [Candidatus Omnitrophota bacterium]